jgi:hypothetical protein
MKLYPFAISKNQVVGPLISEPDPDQVTALGMLFDELTASIADPSRIMSMDSRIDPNFPPGVASLSIYWPDDLTTAERAAADALFAAHRPT